MGASGLIFALTSDRSWVITVAAAVLAFVTRLNPVWMPLAGGALGFTGVIRGKSLGKTLGPDQKAIQSEWAGSPVGGSYIDE